MRIHGLGWMSLTILTMVVTSYGATLPVRAKTTLAIPDISEWQGRLSAADVRHLKSKVAFVINRRQYGADYVDPDATNNTDLYVRYGIPFGEYDFSQFTGVKSARLEARDFYARSNKHARFYVLDFEINTVKHGTTNAAVDAWVAQMRALTNKKLIFYSYASFATAYANQARQRFNAQWIAAYNSRGPAIPCALWQYTDSARIPGIMTNVDNSKLFSRVHPLSWWTGATSTTPTVAVVTKPVAPVTVVKRAATKPVTVKATRARAHRVVEQHRQQPVHKVDRSTKRSVRAAQPRRVRVKAVKKSRLTRTTVKATYYHRMPRQRRVRIRQTTHQYRTVTFNQRERLHQKLQRGQRIKVDQIGHRANGSWYFRSNHGRYFTANRKVVAE